MAAVVAGENASSARRPHVSDLTGAWERRLLVRADGSRDVRTRVDWLQAGTLYVDLRQPREWRPRADSLHLLGTTALRALAAQEGFAGRLEDDGDAFTWHRAVDFQPPTGRHDAGRLRYDGDLLVEDGVGEPYVEHWERRPDPSTPRIGLLLRDRDGRTGVLVRTGNFVGWARDRAEPLARARSLADVLEATADPAAARMLLDCEISVGTVSPTGRCRLVRSTLPAAAGSTLEVFVLPDGTARTREVRPDGTRTTRSWKVLMLEGCASALPRSRGDRS